MPNPDYPVFALSGRYPDYTDSGLSGPFADRPPDYLVVIRIIGAISGLCRVSSVEIALLAKSPRRQIIISYWPLRDKPPL
jgi:hypothetical protein